MFSTASYSPNIRNSVAKLTKRLLHSTAWHNAICLSHLGYRAKTDLFCLDAQLFSKQQLEEAHHSTQRPEPHCSKPR